MPARMPRSFRFRRPLRRLAAAAGLIGLSALGLALLAPRLLAPAVIEITSPDPELVIGNEALEVFVHFPRPERTRAETLRVLLNGADVSDAFETAANGAYGSVVRVVDGDNWLRVGVFARPWWGGDALVEHSAELHFTVRRPIDGDWAALPPASGGLPEGMV